MTTDQFDRLNRIEQNLERVAQQQEVNTAALAELRSTVAALVEIVTLHQRDIETSQRNFDVAARNFEAIQADIRGLQLENRRMLEELRGRRDDEQT